MLPSTSTTFVTSSLIVTHNAVKNVIFRTATIILDFAILRLFGLLAFRRDDYTSFLMFAEDLIQKAWFVSSRGITARQSLLVGVFALIATAGEFYDTMLWALDNPGYVMQHKLVNGATLTSQLASPPAYVVMTSDEYQQSETSLNASFELNLYNPGLNFTLPGIFEEGAVEVVPPLFPLSPITTLPITGTPRIWLDDEGFAVGVDFTFINTDNMLLNANTTCVPYNPPNVTVNQVWDCNIPVSEGVGILSKSQGWIPIWWDIYHQAYLTPFGDNPWSSLGTNGGTIMMRQVFTITKGHRRHTFKQVVIKATMTAAAPNNFDEGEVADFMRRTWSTYGPPFADGGVQDIIDIALSAIGNNTGRTFGSLNQAITSVSATYTEFLNDLGVGDYNGYVSSSFLRFTMVNTTLIRSETLAEEVIPVVPCPGAVVSDWAAGGNVVATGCTDISVDNQTLPLNQNPFLGRIDTSCVAIFVGFLGDGTTNMSSLALSQSGTDWLAQQDDHIDSRLISRAMLMGGNASAVMVDVGTTVAAMSGVQLLLCILPGVLAVVIWWFTRDPAMSHYQNSFLVAVLATTHTTAVPCEELGYIHSMPEITLQRRGRHITLGTPYEGTISNTVATPADKPDMVYEPLILDGDTT